MSEDGIIVGEDGVARCWWADSAPEYRAYHDHEWGFPVSDDVRLFEKLSLEGFQAGLSWLTILRKREAFRSAFAGFEFERIARFDECDVARLLGDAGIVRHRGKIEAVLNNARRALELVDAEGSLAAYAWRFEPEPRTGRLDRARLAELATTRRVDRRWPRTSSGEAGGLSARPPCTRSCRPWAWSTTTSAAATPGRAWTAPGSASSGREPRRGGSSLHRQPPADIT